MSKIEEVKAKVEAGKSKLVPGTSPGSTGRRGSAPA